MTQYDRPLSLSCRTTTQGNSKGKGPITAKEDSGPYTIQAAGSSSSSPVGTQAVPENWEVPKKTCKASRLPSEIIGGMPDAQTQKADNEIRRYGEQPNLEAGTEQDANNYFSPLCPDTGQQLEETSTLAAVPDEISPDGILPLSPIVESLAVDPRGSPCMASLPDTTQDLRAGRTLRPRKGSSSACQDQLNLKSKHKKGRHKDTGGVNNYPPVGNKDSDRNIEGKENTSSGGAKILLTT